MIYGSDVNSVDRPIEIAPGHRVRSLGVVDLSPSDAVRQGVFRDYHHWIQPDPQAELQDDADGKKVLLRRVHRSALKGNARRTTILPTHPTVNCSRRRTGTTPIPATRSSGMRRPASSSHR